MFYWNLNQILRFLSWLLEIFAGHQKRIEEKEKLGKLKRLGYLIVILGPT